MFIYLVITNLSGDDTCTTCTAAQDKGEFADLGQTGWHDPPDVSRARRQDHWQHEYGHHELGDNEERSRESGEWKSERWTGGGRKSRKTEKVFTFIMTRVSVSTSRMVSSYSTNVGNTWRPAASHQHTRDEQSLNVQKLRAVIKLSCWIWPIEAKKMMARKSRIGSMHPVTSVVTMWPWVDSKAPARKHPSSMETSRKSVAYSVSQREKQSTQNSFFTAQHLQRNERRENSDE